MPDQGLGTTFYGGLTPEDWLLSGTAPPPSPYDQSPLGPSWLQRAQDQTQRDIANYQQGGVPQMLADTTQTQDLAGGFGGNIKSVKAPLPLGAAMMQPIRAYHGSPYDFDKFDLSKIGTGEGAQVYGHGLYFAEKPEVAQSYKASGQPSYLGADRISAAQQLLKDAGGDRATALNLAQERMSGTTKYGEGKLWQDVINNFDHLMGTTPGKMYEVNINADPQQFLQWDQPLKDQPIAETVARLVPRDLRQPFESNVASGISGSNAYMNYIPHESFAVRSATGQPFGPSSAKTYEEALQSVGGNSDLVRTILNPDRAQSSAALQQAGIPGIRYLDQGSRPTQTAEQLIEKYGSREAALAVAQERQEAAAKTFGAASARRQWQGDVNSLKGPQTSNYVVFDPKIIDIIRKYGLAGVPAGSLLANQLLQMQQPNQQ